MKCIVIGSGFAGLSAAVYLSKNDIQVTLLEASPKLGGRAYSFPHNSNSEKIIDNGQHIMMSCYHYTLDFLKIIKAEKYVDIQDKLRAVFVRRNGRQYTLEVKSNLYPLNLLNAVINYGGIKFPDRLRILWLFKKLIYLNEDRIKHLSVKEWLEKNHQTGTVQKAFWEILTVGTLNTTMQKASAYQFAFILKEIFLSGNDSTKIAIPKTGLSEMYCNNAADFIQKNGGKINLSEKAEEVKVENKKIVSVKSSKKNYKDFDFVVSTIPEYSLRKITENITELPYLEYAPIMTIHLWLRSNPFTERFYGLVDSEIHWVFNHGTHISLVKSAAEKFVDVEKKKLLFLIYSELENYFPIFYKDLVTDHKIIIEKRATFIPSINSLKERENIRTSIKNLVIAGDWTDTKLPSTIESAVKSGKIAAEKIISFSHR